MRLPLFRRKYDPITTLLKTTDIWLDASNKLYELQKKAEDGSYYSRRDLQRILGSYFKTKRRLERLGSMEETAGNVSQLIATLEMHEKLLGERLPESYRGALKQYTPEEVAEGNRRVELYMDQWRKAHTPGIYQEGTSDMRAIEMPVREMVIRGGSYLPESKQQGALMSERLLRYGREHTPRLDYNLN